MILQAQSASGNSIIMASYDIILKIEHVRESDIDPLMDKIKHITEEMTGSTDRYLTRFILEESDLEEYFEFSDSILSDDISSHFYVDAFKGARIYFRNSRYSL